MAGHVAVRCAMVASVLGCAALAQAQTYMEAIPLPTGSTFFTVDGISGDGSTVVGHSTGQAAYRFRRGSGLQSLSTMIPYGVNGDGNLIVGTYINSNNVFFARAWTPQGTQAIPVADGLVQGASPDGFVALATAQGPSSSAYLWRSGQPAVAIPVPAGNSSGYGNDVSIGGAVVVGETRSFVSPNRGRAFFWTAAGGSQLLAEIAGTEYSAAMSVTPDGTVAVGRMYVGTLRYSARWDLLSGDLTLLPFVPGQSLSTPWGISDDASIIVGSVSPGFGYVYTATRGLMPATEYLASFGLNMSGWTISVVRGVSGDGLTFAGDGTYQGVQRSWIAHVPSGGTGLTLLMSVLVLGRRRR